MHRIGADRKHNPTDRISCPKKKNWLQFAEQNIASKDRISILHNSRMIVKGGIPDGFEIIHLPEYEWAVFTCRGPMPDAIQNMWERVYKEWLPVADYELIPDYDIENYLPGDASAKDYISEICIPVRKKEVK